MEVKINQIQFLTEFHEKCEEIKSKAFDATDGQPEKQAYFAGVAATVHQLENWLIGRISRSTS